MRFVAARAARTAHKWLALLVGVQLLLWTGSGVYMTAVDLDFIHGDALVRNLAPPLDLQAVRVPPEALRERFPDLTALKLRALPTDGTPVYEVSRPAGTTLVEARTGRQLSPLAPEPAAEIARAYYAADGVVERVTLIERDPPIELQGRSLPLWRVDFDDWLDTTLYIDPDTARLVVRRHRFWRWFDFLWMLHIMDYDERSDVNNVLLRVATVIAALAVLSGAWLVAYEFRWGRRRRTR